MVRDAIVSKIISEEKTTSSMMVEGAQSKEQKVKRKINLYQEGLSFLDDRQANITETITDNENQQYIQYQEVGTINATLNARFDNSKPREGECTRIKMRVLEESASQRNQNRTYSMNSPGSQ